MIICGNPFARNAGTDNASLRVGCPEDILAFIFDNEHMHWQSEPK